VICYNKAQITKCEKARVLELGITVCCRLKIKFKYNKIHKIIIKCNALHCIIIFWILLYLNFLYSPQHTVIPNSKT
jgi:hypothetical protein